MTLLIFHLFSTIYHFLEIIHESANRINELNDSQVIRTVSNGQVQEFTSPRVTNKYDDFEKILVLKMKMLHPCYKKMYKRFVEK